MRFSSAVLSVLGAVGRLCGSRRGSGRGVSRRAVGVFVLVALTGGGSLVAPVAVWGQMTDPPDAPTDLAAVSGDGLIRLSWTAPSDTGDAAISGYDVEHKTSTASDQAATTPGDPTTGWVDAADSGTDTTHTITGLTNDIAYNVRVRAKNTHGDSSWLVSVGAYVVVPPPAPPTGVTSVPGDQQLVLSWTATPDGDNALGADSIAGYDVEYKTAAAPNGPATGSDPSTGWVALSQVPPTTDPLGATVTGLANDVLHFVRVAAVNNAGGRSRWTVPHVWEATFPSIARVGGQFGCNNSVSSARCSDAAVLTEDEFSIAGEDYVVNALVRVDATADHLIGQNMRIDLDKDLPASVLSRYVASFDYSGLVSFAAVSDRLTGQYFLDGSLPSWSVGDTVEVALFDSAAVTPVPANAYRITPRSVDRFEQNSVSLTVELANADAPTGGLTFTVAPDYTSAGDCTQATAADVTLPESVMVPAGQRSVSFSLGLDADAELEGTECFSLSVSTQTAGWNVAGTGSDTVSVSISDLTREFSWNPTAVSVAEGQEKITGITIGAHSSFTLTNDNFFTLKQTEPDVHLVATAGTATAADYSISTVAGNTLDNTAIAFEIVTVADAVAEVDEMFTVEIDRITLHGASGGFKIGSADTLTVTIVDDRSAATVSGAQLVPGDGGLSLSWTAPATGAGVSVTGYDVEYKTAAAPAAAATTPGDPSTGWVAASRSGTTASQAISSLTNATVYQVRVRAEFSSGFDGGWTTMVGRPLAVLDGAVWSATLVAGDSVVLAGSPASELGRGCSAHGREDDGANPASGFDWWQRERCEHHEVLSSSGFSYEGSDYEVHTVAANPSDTAGISGPGLLLGVGGDLPDEALGVLELRVDDVVLRLSDAQKAERAGRDYLVWPRFVPGWDAGAVVSLSLHTAMLPPPKQIRSDPHNGNLIVTWSPPAGEVTGYDLEYKTAAAADQAAATQGDPSTGWVTSACAACASGQFDQIDRLANGTVYDVRVRAKNADGVGEWGVPVIWEAILAARVTDTATAGCDDSTTGGECEPGGLLSDDDFSHGGTDFDVAKVNYGSGSSALSFATDQAAADHSLSGLVLDVDGSAFAFSAATTAAATPNQYDWSSASLEWAERDWVRLQLIDPDRTTPQNKQVEIIATATATENANAELPVRLGQPAPSSGVVLDVDYGFTSGAGNAAAADLGSARPTTLTVTGGETLATLLVPIADDDLVEGPETFTVTLSASTPGWGVRTAARQATVTIRETEGATVAFGTAGATAAYTATVAENVAGGTLDVPVVVSHLPAAATTFAVEVLSASTATEGASGDYRIATKSVRFTPTGAKTANLRITLRDDGDVESDETIRLRIAAADSPVDDLGDHYSRHSTGSTATITVTSEDTTPATKTYSIASAADATEGASVSLAVSLSEAAPSEGLSLSVSYGLQDAAGRAVAADLGSARPTSLTVSGGATTATLRVPIANDAVVEGPETFTVTISTTASGWAAGTTATATVTIGESESATVAFGTAGATSTYTATVAENARTLDVPVAISHQPAAATTFAVEVLGASTATEGAAGDFEIATKSVSFTPSGARTANLRITLHDDDDVESNETIRLRIAAADSPANDLGDHYSRGTAAQATITITSEDETTTTPTTPVTPTVTLSASPNPVRPAAVPGNPDQVSQALVTITATLSRALPHPVIIPVTVNSAAPDHGTIDGIVISANTRTGTARILVIEDLDTSDDTFTVAIDAAGLPDTVIAGNPAAVTVTVADTDDAAAPPSAPANFTVTPKVRYLLLQWDKPAARTTHYDIQYKTAAAPNQPGSGGDPTTGWISLPQYADENATTRRVTRLTSGTTYDVRVRAVNSQTPGPWATQQGTPQTPTVAPVRSPAAARAR